MEGQSPPPWEGCSLVCFWTVLKSWLVWLLPVLLIKVTCVPGVVGLRGKPCVVGAGCIVWAWIPAPATAVLVGGGAPSKKPGGHDLITAQLDLQFLTSSAGISAPLSLVRSCSTRFAHRVASGAETTSTVA